MAIVRSRSASQFSLYFVFINALTYMTFVISRSSMDAILPSLIAGNGILKDNRDAAILVSVGHMGYFLSKLFAGLFLDFEMFRTISSNYLMLVCITIGCLISLLLMSISFNSVPLTVGWFAFRGISSWIWIVMTRLIYNRFRQSKNSVVAWSFMSVGSRGGQVVGAVIFSIMLVLGLNWRNILLAAGLILSTSMIWNSLQFIKEKSVEKKQEYLMIPSTDESLLGDSLIGWGEASTDDEHYPSEDELNSVGSPVGKPKRIPSPISPQAVNTFSPAGSAENSRFWIFSVRLWVMIVATSMISILFEINSFFPIFILNQHNIKTELAPLYASPLYFAAFLSLSGSTIIYDQLTNGWRSIITIFSLISSLVAFLTIAIFPGQPIYTMLIMGFIIGFSLAPVYYLPSNIFSIFFGGKDSCAKVSATLEAVSFAVTALVDAFVIGPMIRYGIWTGYFYLMASLSAASIIFFGIYFQLETRKVF